MLNNGLLTPSYVLQQVLNYLKKNHNLEDFYNSIEGFIRQIIGWREWMKLLYEFKYDQNFGELNFFKAQEKLPSYFYDLKNLPENTPLTLAIQKVSKLSWAHHIERLMILSNWMTLNSYNPKECYEWFLSQFVDAYEWVMVPNVYGMGLFADGGFFATKPYISGGAYIKKMSDYKDNGWVKLWTDRYWQFLKNNKSQLKDNPRMKLILSKVA
jgi:deoxyribodipyrimidine photolyase-related protein